MATYRYNVIVDLTVGSAQGGAQSAQAQVGAIATQMNQVNTAARQATNQVQLLGAAFKGAFIGAITGFAVRATLGNILDLGTALKDAGVAAVKASADFEVTRNAFRVFTGSTSAATAELRQIAEVARNTPGLRLEDAEAGARNLRALGFEAQLARDLVEGLGKQKILSGADEGAINRVIVNLTQLASGSPRASQDIKEMIQSVRTLRPEIIEAFGSIEKFKSDIARDPRLALEKFSEALKDTQVPAAGLNDAIGKLQDAGIKAGRIFGEPILEPLTNDVIQLTNWVEDNAKTWAAWGQTVGDAIRGVSVVFDTLTKNAQSGPVEDFLNRTLLAVATGGVSEVLGNLVAIGEAERKRIDKLTVPFEDRYRRGDLRRDFTVNFANPNLFRTDREIEIETQRKQAETQRANQREADRKQALLDLSRNGKEVEKVLNSQYAVQQAQLDQHLRTTREQELDYLRASRDLRLNNLQDQLTITKTLYDQQIALTEVGTKERLDLMSERSVALAEIESQIAITTLRTNKQIAQQEKEIQDERRQNEIQFYSLKEQAATAFQSRQEFLINKEIDLYETGYDKLLDLADTTYNQMVDLAILATNKQLEAEDLTAEQRVNIQSELNIRLYELETERIQRIDAIQEQQLRNLIERMKQYRQAASAGFGELGTVFGSVQSTFFSPDTFSSSVYNRLQRSLLGGDLRQQVPQANEAARVAGNRFSEAINLGITGAGLKAVEDAYDQAGKKAADLNAELKNLNDSVPDLVRNFAALADQITGSNIGAFDEIATRTLEAQQKLAREDLQAEIDLYRDLDIIEKDAARKRENQLHLNRLLSQQRQQLIDQESEKLELYNKTLDGLIDRYDRLAKRDPKLLGAITRVLEGDLRGERNAALTELRRAEILASDEKLLNLAQETELIREITALRNEELEAVLLIGRAELRINQQLTYSKTRADARVADFLAGQRGITEIISDTKINALTAAYNGLDSVIGRLTKHFGLFADAVRDLLSGLIKLGLNQVFGRLFGLPTGGNVAGGGGGGFSLFGGGGGGGGLFSFGGGGLFGGGIPGIGPGGTGTFAGGGGTIAGPFGLAIPAPGSAAGAGLLGQGAAQGSTVGSTGLFSSLFGGGGLAGLAPLAPILGGALGASLGGQSGFGRILGGIGGVLGGVGALGLIGGAGALAPIFGGLGLGLGASLTAAAAATVVGLVAAPLLLFGAYVLGRNARRRQEERIRNKAILDSFAAIDKLIEGVNNDQLDGAQALQQADQIRQQYVEEMSKLKDSKTRRHALQDVSRIDAKISELKTAVGNQVSRRERLELLVPTFAGGGSVGYQSGPGHGKSDNLYRYFPSAGTHGYTSPTEYVLDADTVGVVGRHDLDVMRATKGQSYAYMRRQMVSPRRAVGGSIVGSPSINYSGATGTGGSSGPMTLELSVNIGLSQESFVQVISAAIRNNDGSREQITALAKALQNNGETQLVSELSKLLKPYMNQ